MKPLPRDGRVILAIENGMATDWRPLITCGGCKWRGPENSMSDLIDRQAAIEVLSWFTQTDPLGYTPRQILSALPSAQPEQRWIPVSERLPEEDTERRPE